MCYQGKHTLLWNFGKGGSERRCCISMYCEKCFKKWDRGRDVSSSFYHSDAQYRRLLGMLKFHLASSLRNSWVFLYFPKCPEFSFSIKWPWSNNIWLWEREMNWQHNLINNLPFQQFCQVWVDEGHLKIIN